MRTIDKRLEKLERTFAPLAGDKTDNQAADLRARIRRSASSIGQPAAAELEKLLDEVGPQRFHTELHRAHLIAHGFVQNTNESLAETTCRAAGISPEELKARMFEGKAGMAFVYEQIRLRGIHSQA
jgi:hypothetical protein